MVSYEYRENMEKKIKDLDIAERISKELGSKWRYYKGKEIFSVRAGKILQDNSGEISWLKNNLYFCNYIFIVLF